MEAEVLQAEEVSSSISTAKAKIAQRLTPTSFASAATPPRRTDAHTLPASLPVHEHITRPRGWHLRMLCTLIFVRGQNLDRKFFYCCIASIC